MTETRLQFWPLVHSLPFLNLLFLGEKKKKRLLGTADQCRASKWVIRVRAGGGGIHPIGEQCDIWSQCERMSTQSWAGQSSPPQGINWSHWLALTGGWAGRAGPRWPHSCAWCLGGEDSGWKTGLSWDYQLEHLHEPLQQGSYTWSDCLHAAGFPQGACPRAQRRNGKVFAWPSLKSHLVSVL